MRDTSLVYPRRGGMILLGRKRRGMGYGKWNGFGGKTEAGETMRECAVRELYEECGLLTAPSALAERASLYFHKPSDPSWSHAGIVYVTEEWEGTPQRSDEMEPSWFPLEELPYEEMWDADWRWLPLVLAGKRVKGTIYFEDDGETVSACHLEEVSF